MTYPLYIGPWQTPIKAPGKMKLGSYYLSSSDIVFDRKLTGVSAAEIPFEYLPLAVTSRCGLDDRNLQTLQQATHEMSKGRWQSVYLPTRPGLGNNSGNGMTGSFFQTADLEVSIRQDKKGKVTSNFHWPKIKKYASRYRIQAQNFNYSLAYHKYRGAFETAFKLFIESVFDLDSRFLALALSRDKIGLYCGITDYYGDPSLLPEHLLQQALAENPNPEEFSKVRYLQELRAYRKYPILPGNYHTDGIEKGFDVQGIFTIKNDGVNGGATFIRRRGIRRHNAKNGLRPGEHDVTVKLKSKEGHVSLWVPSWGRTEVEHTPGPIQGGHRTIIVLGLDSSDVEMQEEGSRQFYGTHNETRSWERRMWYKNGGNIRAPNSRLWNVGE